MVSTSLTLPYNSLYCHKNATEDVGLLVAIRALLAQMEYNYGGIKKSLFNALNRHTNN